MTKRLFKDVPAGEIIITQDRMEDEVREVVYLRLDADADAQVQEKHGNPAYIAAVRIGLFQGDPFRLDGTRTNLNEIRYKRVSTHGRDVPAGTIGIMDGRYPCKRLDQTVFPIVLHQAFGLGISEVGLTTAGPFHLPEEERTPEEEAKADADYLHKVSREIGMLFSVDKADVRDALLSLLPSERREMIAKV